MAEQLYTLDEIEEIKKLYIEDEEVDEIKEFIEKTFTSRFDWRNSFKSLDCYNRTNFLSGLLDKLQTVRRTTSCESLDHIIELLYVLGYSLKRIVFICWKFGFKFENRQVIQKFIQRNKRELAIKRREFMMTLSEEAKKIFQDCQAEAKAVEKKTLEIHLKAISQLQEQLESLDIITNKTEYWKVTREIENLQKKINSVHGIQEMRNTLIETAGKIAVEEAKVHAQEKIRSGKDKLPQLGEASDQQVQESRTKFLDE